MIQGDKFGKYRSLLTTYEHIFICCFVLNEDQTIELADIFRLLGDPTRLRIVLACMTEPVSVGALAEQLDLSQSLVSHHLRLLRAARLVRADRRGKQVFYLLADEHVASVLVDMIDHVREESSEHVDNPDEKAAGS